MDQVINNIQLTWKLTWLLRTYRICNSTVEFSKYEFKNKLLGNVTQLRIILYVSWKSLSLSLSLYIYIYIYMYWVQVTPDVILSNVTPLNNLL